MPHHDVVHKMARTIRGMKLEFKCEAPVAADVEPITDKVEQAQIPCVKYIYMICVLNILYNIMEKE